MMTAAAMVVIAVVAALGEVEQALVGPSLLAALINPAMSLWDTPPRWSWIATGSP